jgi:formylglycine-generating enzyme required for sulfatase activity
VGRLVLLDSMGLVFVLIPGGTFEMGAQCTDEAGPNYDPQARKREAPVHDVELSPFFLSKYEMTQGQWERFAGSNPSLYLPNMTVGGRPQGLLHPVEQVSWEECTGLMARMSLALPTEAQWEYACRAGSRTPWWTGSDRESLRGKVNLADQSVKRDGMSWSEIDDWPDLDDGWVVHAPIGTFPANPFGLHEVHGNVWEWCADGEDDDFYAKSPRLDPVQPVVGNVARIYRGGSFANAATHARSSNRYDGSPDYKHFSVGLRPARPLRTTR